jgi:hypothetical protein
MHIALIKDQNKILSNYYNYIGKLILMYIYHNMQINNYCYIPILFDQQLCFQNDIEPNLIEFCSSKNHNV